MKKTIKLSETQLTNVVKRIISEQEMNIGDVNFIFRYLDALV